MDWRKPELVDLNQVNNRAQLRCFTGSNPNGLCAAGGGKSSMECNRGGFMPEPGCIMGGGEDI